MANIDTQLQFQSSHAKFQELSDKATDYLLKSFKFPQNSLEWQICRLKRDLYMRDALAELRKAVSCLPKN